MAENSLEGRIALVTGASRGLGKGIAIELAAAGATVYVTARRLEDNSSGLGALEASRAEIAAMGGRCIAVACDQGVDREIRALVDRIGAEQGRLEILVNNAYPGVNLGSGWQPFWEAPPENWDAMVGVGLRSHYIASAYAMPLLIEAGGLVVNISSGGSYAYLGSVPYAVGKAGMDALARFMAVELAATGVTPVSLWPGFVRTELMMAGWKESPEALAAALKLATAHFDFDPWALSGARTGLAVTETPRFTGRAVVALARDERVKMKAGKTLAVVRLADEYGFTDIDGTSPDAFHFRRSSQWPALTGDAAKSD